LSAPGGGPWLAGGRGGPARRDVWHAADLFVSPSDNIQETFGLAVLEAMASGLPVVASDWDGYRDLVEDGVSGFLVPTAMVEGATTTAAARLLMGELTYGHFLAECSQATTVATPAMAAALARLAGDEALRHRMGAAGRLRAREQFAWPRIISAYEQLWRDLDAERRAWASSGSSPHQDPARPAAYPAPQRTFAGYPPHRLRPADRLAPAPGAGDALESLLAMPLTHHAPDRRVADAALLRAAFAAAPCSVDDLDRFWARSGIEPGL